MPAEADKARKQANACFLGFFEQEILSGSLLLLLLLGGHVELLSVRLR
jgi:hypothetical protein